MNIGNVKQGHYMKVRNNLSNSVVSVASDNVLCANADEVERKALIVALKAACDNRLDKELVELDEFFIQLQSASSLGYAHKPVSKMLVEFLRSRNFRDRGAVTRNGDLLISVSGKWKSVEQTLQRDPMAVARLSNFVDAAKETGGVIRTYESASSAQWLCFHELKIPKNVEQVKHLLSFLEWKWPAPDHLDDYWEQITGHDGESVVLTPAQYKEIRTLTATFVPNNQSLLDMLYKNVRPALSDRVDWHNANEVIALLVGHSFAQELAKKYIDALKWWGANENDAIDESDLAHVLLTAILLQLDPFFGKNSQRNCIGSYDIYEPRDAADRLLLIIREGLEDYLVNNEIVSRSLVPLASHLMLASIAPGFLVNSLPSNLVAGSIGWVTFSQAVSFVELNAKGASRFMTYEQVMKFADMDSISSSLGQLQGIAAIDAIIDWALINEVIFHEDLEASPTDATEAALSAYQTHVECMALGAKAFSAVPPNRKKLALAALEMAAPGCDFLEQKILRPETFSSVRMSMLDLHIEGELTSGTWNWNNDGHIVDRYPRLSYLAPNQPIFEAAVHEHHATLHKALASNIKLAMAQMLSIDRDILQRSEITFFTVRLPVVELVASSVSSVGLIGVNNKGPQPKETQAKKDAATGRFAVIMLADDGNQTLCYEMFSLLGECRRNNKLGELIQGGRKKNMPSRLEFKGGLNDYVHPVSPTHTVPIDLRSYTHGTKPRPNASCSVVIEKLGTLSAPTSIPDNKRSLYQYFVSPPVNSIAEFIVSHRPLATVGELNDAFTELTEREQTHKTTDAVVTYIVDLAVPFKKCIEDLVSGDKNRIVDGVYGCTMDAIGIFFTVLGAPSIILSIAAKTVSLTSRICSFVRFGLNLTVSTFNPIDGLPTAGYRASKALFKSNLQLGKSGTQLLEVTTSQLRRLTGKARSVDLLQVACLPHLGQGKWRPRGSVGDALNVCVLSKSNQWFAVNKFGRPWGRQLVDFDFKQAFSLSSIRPANYTRQIIHQSLPIARQKIEGALSVLKIPLLNAKTNLAIGLFLGSTPKARDNFMTFLTAIRTDFGGTSASNFLLDSAKVDENIVELNQFKYGEWQKVVSAERENVEYMTINTHNFNDRFISTGFNYGEIADDLIHEMFRASLGSAGLVSAKAALQDNAEGLNVAALLNLAAGRLPKTEIRGAVEYHNSAEALVNADSYALLTALLSQFSSDITEYRTNFDIMNAAVKGNAGRTIDVEVLVNLNSD